MGKTKHELKNWWQMATLPESKLTRPRNKTVYWSDTDSEENFRLNPLHNYTETSITYTYNSHGFRTKEFEPASNRDNVLFLGCSHTEGIGLKEEDTWVNHITTKIEKLQDWKVLQGEVPLAPNGFNYYNLGIGGGSGDTVVRNLVNCTNHLIPSVVFILWPPSGRFDYYQQDGDYSFWDTKSVHNLSTENLFLYEEAHIYNNHMRNTLIVDLLKKMHGFTLVELSADDLHTEFTELPKSLDYARDGHWPPSFHRYIAEKFFGLFKYILHQQFHSLDSK